MSNQVFDNLAGKLLISSPYMMSGSMFHKSLIYVLIHTKDSAIGVIVNHLVSNVKMKSLFKSLNENVADDSMLSVYLGGPVELDKGFLLHSGEYDKNLLFKFDDNLAVSSNMDIINDIAIGNGPHNSMFMIGYTGWSAGQLEAEIENNLWIVSEYDKKLIFSEPNEKKWQKALNEIGIEPAYFASHLGMS